MPTKWLRFRDLKARGIVKNWPTLKRRVEKDGFPPGRMTGPNERTWTEEEIDEWYASRPVEGPEPRGVAKTRTGNPGPRKRKATASTTEAASA
jgi:predicted DNA-binding transcriptional regulator AlpA